MVRYTIYTFTALLFLTVSQLQVQAQAPIAHKWAFSVSTGQMKTSETDWTRNGFVYEENGGKGRYLQLDATFLNIGPLYIGANVGAYHNTVVPKLHQSIHRYNYGQGCRTSYELNEEKVSFMRYGAGLEAGIKIPLGGGSQIRAGLGTQRLSRGGNVSLEYTASTTCPEDTLVRIDYGDAIDKVHDASRKSYTKFALQFDIQTKRANQQICFGAFYLRPNTGGAERSHFRNYLSLKVGYQWLF